MILEGSYKHDKLYIRVARRFVYFDAIFGNDGGSCFKIEKEKLKEVLK